MNETNVYKSPDSEPIDPQSQVSVSTGPFSLKGRINRVQYIAYTVGLVMLIYFVFGLIIGFIGAMTGSTGLMGVISSLLFAGLGIGIIVFTIICGVRRSHDFNTTGWLSVLSILPLVNLIFWFIPGTRGSNRFGEQPKKSSMLLTIVAVLFPLLFLVGVLSAIAIPAYQDYVARAQVGECLTTSAELKTLVAHHYQSTGEFVTKTQIAHLPNGGITSGRYCQSSIDFAQKAIVSTFNTDDAVALPVRGGVIQFDVDIEQVRRSGVFEYSCTSSNIESRFLPKVCSGAD